MVAGLATHWPWSFVGRLLVLVLCAQQFAGFLEVQMAGRTQIVLLNANATIFCKIPGSPHLDIRIMGITWFWKSQESSEEVKIFEFFGDHQNPIRPGATVSLSRLKKGDASLQLPGVQLEEAGAYRCEVVVTPQKAQGWVWLEVVAYPASSLLPETAMVETNEEQTLVCKTSGFYPESINITWQKWTQKFTQFMEISEGITTGPTIKNNDGTFNITSFLKLKPTVEDSGNVYQCVVWHKLLSSSLRFNSTVIVNKSEKNYFWVGGVFAVLVFIFVFIFLKKRYCHVCQTSKNSII
ncbi:natural cytotoxicity triggering receptor 3 ligand 1 [Trichechus inunguis]